MFNINKEREALAKAIASEIVVKMFSDANQKMRELKLDSPVSDLWK